MFCMKCGTRLEDNAMFCFSCGNKVESAQPAVQEPVMMQPVVEEVVTQPVVEEVFTEEPVVMAPPVVEEPVVQEPVVMAPPVVEEPVVQEPVVMAPPVMEQTTVQQPVMQQNAYDQRMYTQPGNFQPVQSQPVQSQPVQQMYQPQAGQPVVVSQQAFYNTPAQAKKKGNASVPAIIFLVVAAIAAVAIAISNFVDGEVGMGIMNCIYFATSIVLIVYSVSEKKIGSICKGIFFAVMLVLNVIFAGISAFGAAIDIFGNAKAGIDYYYAIILLLQYIFLYVYMLISVIRSFMGKEKTSYATCLCGYFAALLIIAAFVIDVVSDLNGLFALGFIPIDLSIVTLIIGDLFATTHKGKKVTE